jgi:predicted DNA-binding protein with PD1-like motif
MDEVRVAAKVSRPGRLLVARILPKTDLLLGLTRICDEHDIKAACIVSMLGGLRKACFLHPIHDPNTKMGINYGQPVELEGPLEFAVGSGVIGYLESGQRFIHLHAVLADLDNRLYTGHLIEGNLVLTTMEAVIQETPDVQLIRSYDEETDLELFKIFERSEK